MTEGFLKIQYSLTIKGKTEKPKFFSWKTICQDTIKTEKREATVRKVLVIHINDKGLIFSLYKNSFFLEYHNFITLMK